MDMKDMTSFPMSDLSRRAGDVVATALREPVILTKHKKPRLIILSIEEYELRTGQKIHDPRTVGLLKDMPADLAAEFAEAALAYLNRNKT